MKNRKLIFFKISLAAAGLTEIEFARRAGVSRQAVRQVLVGETTSAPLEEKIDRFITKRMHGLRVVLLKDEVSQENAAAKTSAHTNGKSAKRLAKALNK